MYINVFNFRNEGEDNIVGTFLNLVAVQSCNGHCSFATIMELYLFVSLHVNWSYNNCYYSSSATSSYSTAQMSKNAFTFRSVISYTLFSFVEI